MLRVGVIGTGNIGTAHIERLSSSIAGASVVAVYDLDSARTATVARTAGAVVRGTAGDVIADETVDAVLITSPGDTHAELVLECLAVGKPVLCEKPLATSTESALAVVQAEVATGRRLVQVGFMRRFDAGYRAMKAVIDDGSIGTPLLAHCVHRNASVPAGFDSDMELTDSLVHEIDVTRWLFGQEIVAVTVIPTRPSPLVAAGTRDPQLVLLRLAEGGVVEVEVFVNCQYGYDVRCEVVGSTGTVSLDDPATVTVAGNGRHSRTIAADWRSRFADAYRAELQEWVDAVTDGEIRGPSAWDGYVATTVAESCVAAVASGNRNIALADRPVLYQPE